MIIIAQWKAICANHDPYGVYHGKHYLLRMSQTAFHILDQNNPLHKKRCAFFLNEVLQGAGGYSYMYKSEYTHAGTNGSWQLLSHRSAAFDPN